MSAQRWFTTYPRGLKFYPGAATLEMIHLDDIVWSLSNICRFGGHLREHYSVLQHTLHVMDVVPVPYKGEAAVHDFPEAYVGDMVRPVKYMLPDYRELEGRLWPLIACKFGVDPRLSHLVKEADFAVLLAERRDLALNNHAWEEIDGTVQPSSFTIKPMPADEVRREFHRRFRELFPAYVD